MNCCSAAHTHMSVGRSGWFCSSWTRFYNIVCYIDPIIQQEQWNECNVLNVWNQMQSIESILGPRF